MGIAAILEVITLVMAGWTAWIVTRIRRQLSSMVVTSKTPIHYSLILRTLAFSVALAISLA
jgi:ABC-type spermidine/putrescine transport system permease subunit I